MLNYHEFRLLVNKLKSVRTDLISQNVSVCLNSRASACECILGDEKAHIVLFCKISETFNTVKTQKTFKYRFPMGTKFVKALLSTYTKPGCLSIYIIGNVTNPAKKIINSKPRAFFCNKSQCIAFSVTPTLKIWRLNTDSIPAKYKLPIVNSADAFVKFFGLMSGEVIQCGGDIFRIA